MIQTKGVDDISRKDEPISIILISRPSPNEDATVEKGGDKSFASWKHFWLSPSLKFAVAENHSFFGGNDGQLDAVTIEFLAYLIWIKKEIDGEWFH